MTGRATAAEAYARCRDRLAAPARVAVTAFPDGSVDTFARLYLDDERLDRRTFARRVGSGASKSFRLVPLAEEPGGQATNMARQAAALGDDPLLVGHCDDPAFAELDVPWVSMGAPARVTVCEFAEGDVVLATESGAIESWTPADLWSVLEDHPEALTADALCVGNWLSFPDLTTVLRELADRDVRPGVVVVDPGDVSASGEPALADLCAALGTLADATRVALSINRREADALATAADADGDDKLAAVRATTGADAVVLHARKLATAVHAGGAHTVPTLHVADRARRTGGGDRFSAGLAHALAADWDWPAALALGNACAAHYVATGRTGDPETLREHVAANAPE
jgi:sugar/nucleoside kinase (ribokinase family)